MSPQSKHDVLVPLRAAILRTLFSPIKYVRGVPRLLYLTRRFAFPFDIALVNTPNGLPLTIRPSDYGQLMMFYFPYCPELQTLLNDILRLGDICFDLGANIGLLTIAMAGIVGSQGRVISVDPNPAVIEQLNNTVQHSGLNQIIVIQAGIAGQSGSGYLAFPNTKWGGSASVEVTTVGNDIYVESTIHLVTVDELVNALTPRYIPDFIKFDIEGGESVLLETMEATLAAGGRPMLLIEFHPQKILKRQGNAETIRKRLQEIGYREYWVTKTGRSYRLQPYPDQAVGHENMLYVTPDHISTRLKTVRLFH